MILVEKSLKWYCIMKLTFQMFAFCERIGVLGHESKFKMTKIIFLGPTAKINGIKKVIISLTWIWWWMITSIIATCQKSNVTLQKELKSVSISYFTSQIVTNLKRDTTFGMSTNDFRFTLYTQYKSNSWYQMRQQFRLDMYKALKFKICLERNYIEVIIIKLLE